MAETFKMVDTVLYPKQGNGSFVFIEDSTGIVHVWNGKESMSACQDGYRNLELDFPDELHLLDDFDRYQICTRCYNCIPKTVRERSIFML